MGKQTSVLVPIEVILASAKFVGDAGQPPYCNVPDCGREPKTMSLCRAHYHRYQRHRQKLGLGRTQPDWKSIEPYVQPFYGTHALPINKRKCHVPGCLSKKYEALGLCYTHYARYKKGLGKR